MKKIAVVLATIPQAGGSHQYAMLMMECLKEKQGIEYELLAICGNRFWCAWCRKNKVCYIEENIPDFSVIEKKFNYSFPFLAKVYNTYFTSIGKLLRKRRVDILLVTIQMYYIPNYNVKKIVPVHDLMHRYECEFPEVAANYKNREIIMKSFAIYADCIIVDSKLGKKQFVESYLNGQMKRKHIVVLPFIASEHICNSEEEYIKVPKKYVFYPAQFWQHKNHINLIKAIEILKDSMPDIHLVLVGSEKNNLKNIKRYINDNKLENNVTILGFVSNENVIYLYKHATAMIMPSYFGPTNIPPLEAMALGCPVAVANKYAMPEQVGKAGLLFNPDSPEEIAECIKKFWLDDALREKMKTLGYERIVKWGRKEFSERLQKIVNEFL